MLLVNDLDTCDEVVHWTKLNVDTHIESDVLAIFVLGVGLQTDVPQITFQVNELKDKMQSSGMPWPGDESPKRWEQAWMAIKKVKLFNFLSLPQPYVMGE